MPAETRICQSCKKEFPIYSEDIEFYEKIKVPPPTWCPNCRIIRRLISRNERALYVDECDFCKKRMISRFAPELPYTVYCNDCFHSDKWDPASYGRDYDLTRSFFEQFGELLRVVPKMGILAINAVNAEYGSQLRDVKDVYMGISVVKSENISNSYRVDTSKDCFNVSYVEGSEQCADLMGVERCSMTSNSWFITDTVSSQLLYNCKNCQDCISCVNVRNGRYRIGDVQYSREDYLRERKVMGLDRHSALTKAKDELLQRSLRYPRRFAQLEQCVNVVGDRVHNAKNGYWCFECNNIENCRYMLGGIMGVKDSQDMCYTGLNTELCYEGWSVVGPRILFSSSVQPARDVTYSQDCFGVAELFGCASAKQMEYSILNKRYSKEEYTDLKTKIIAHMDEMPYIDALGRTYTYGEFFPPEFSPFAYNESAAFDYFPTTKEVAVAAGYRWREPDQKERESTMTASAIPDAIGDVPDTIVDAVIECEHQGTCVHGCTTAYRIIPKELEFYRKMKLPLSRLCLNCRHHERLQTRNPFNLWKGKCHCAGAASTNGAYANTITHFHGDTPCIVEFQTPYAPDRPEIVYCEQCYQAEVA